MRERWSAQEIAILTSTYSTDPMPIICAKLSRHSVDSIYKMAERLGINRPSSNLEATIHTQLRGVDDAILLKVLQEFNEKSVLCATARPRWTPIEIEFLRRNIYMPLKYLSDNLANTRTPAAIQRKREQILRLRWSGVR